MSHVRVLRTEKKIQFVLGFFFGVLLLSGGMFLGMRPASAGVSRLTLESEVATGWLSQEVGVEGTFVRVDSRERNLLLRRDERERLRKRRKGIAPIRWWSGYRFSRMAYAGISGAGDTAELAHRLRGGLGIRFLPEFDLAFQLGIEDYPTEPLGAGFFDITGQLHLSSIWSLQARLASTGIEKRGGGSFRLDDGSTLSPAAASAQKTLWGLRIRSEPSSSLGFYLGGSLSWFGGDPGGVMDSMNGFLELSSAQVFQSSGFSPLRSVYEIMRGIHVEAGARFGEIPMEGDIIGGATPWYSELRFDWSRSQLKAFPSVFRVMPGLAFQIQERWRVAAEPEFWLAETGSFDWVANLGLKVAF